LLERIERREAPVERENESVVTLELGREDAGDAHRQHVRDEQRRRQQPEDQLHDIGATHRETAACGDRIEPKERMNDGRNAQ
jgi:hypothetical protein